MAAVSSPVHGSRRAHLCVPVDGFCVTKVRAVTVTDGSKNIQRVPFDGFDLGLCFRYERLTARGDCRAGVAVSALLRGASAGRTRPLSRIRGDWT